MNRWRTYGPHRAKTAEPVTARLFQLFDGRGWSLALLWNVQKDKAAR